MKTLFRHFTHCFVAALLASTTLTSCKEEGIGNVDDISGLGGDD